MTEQNDHPEAIDTAAYYNTLRRRGVTEQAAENITIEYVSQLYGDHRHALAADEYKELLSESRNRPKPVRG